MAGFMNYLKSLAWRGPSIGDPPGRPGLPSSYQTTMALREGDTSMGAYRAMEANTPVEQVIVKTPTPGFEGSAAPPAMAARPGGTLPAFTTFMNSIAGQGLSTDEILARAQAAGIPASQVLTELTKPEYRPDVNPMAYPGTDPRMRVENNFNIPPPGTPGLPMQMSPTEPVASGFHANANPPIMSPLPRMNRPHVAGRHVEPLTAEGTFPDMVAGLPQPSEVDMGASMNYKHSHSPADEVAVILGNMPRPGGSPMQAMLADRTQRRDSFSAPVDIRRSDTMLDAPVRRPTSRRRTFYGG